MGALELIIILLALSGALRLLARVINVPHPVLLVLGGLLLAFIPRLPKFDIAPEVLFTLFVPPLLYWASLTTSLREFKRQAPAIVRYGTLVVLLTIVAVAITFHGLTKEFTWAAAFLLGAIVAPPDPVAAIAVLRPLGVPRTVVSILEGEGLINDATALVCYQVAVNAVVNGQFSLRDAALRFVVGGATGVAVGLAVGWLIAWVRTKLIGRFPVVENTISLLTPFFAYLPAQWLQTSGVLAVVATGLYLGRKGPGIVAAPTRVQAESMWVMVQFLLESLVFMIVGLELRDIVHSLKELPLSTLLWYSAAIVGVLIATRMLYAFSAVALLRAWRAEGQPSWKEAAFVGWTGMRGGDSLVIALALPLTTAAGAHFPARDLIIFLTFAAILGTLVLQGLTIVPLLRVLKLEPDDESDREEAKARHAAARAGLSRLDQLAQGRTVDAHAIDNLRRKYEASLKRWASRDGKGSNGSRDMEAERRAVNYRNLRTEMLRAEREKVVSLRDSGDISDDVLRRIQRDFDLEAMLLEAADDDAPESPYEEA